MWKSTINIGFCNKIIFLIFYFSSLVLFGQQNEDLLNYANEIKVYNASKAVSVCENMLRKTHSKNCDAYEILIEANFILEAYDQTLEYIYKFKNEGCISTFDQTIKVGLIEAEIYYKLNFEAYESETLSNLKSMLNESYEEQEKTMLKELLDCYNIKMQLVGTKPLSSLNGTIVAQDSFSYLYCLKSYSLFASKFTSLVDLKKTFLFHFPNLKEDYETIYYQNFSLIEAQYYFNLKKYNKAIDILQRTLVFLEPFHSHYYYKNNVLELLALNFIEIKEENSLLELRQISNEVEQKVQDMEILAINNIIQNTNDRNNLEYITLSKKKDNLIYMLFLSFILITLIGVLIWFRYYWQERQYTEVESYLSQLKDKSEKKNIKDKPHTKISDNVENKIIAGLKDFEESKEFLNNSVSLAYLASKLEVNTRYLSSFLNSQINESFSSYINRLRIEYIVNKLKKDSKYLKYKISYLAEESGYTSHSSFTTAFKSITGMSPTKFINYLKK